MMIYLAYAYMYLSIRTDEQTTHDDAILETYEAGHMNMPNTSGYLPVLRNLITHLIKSQVRDKILLTSVLQATNTGIPDAVGVSLGLQCDHIQILPAKTKRPKYIIYPLCGYIRVPAAPALVPRFYRENRRILTENGRRLFLRVV